MDSKAKPKTAIVGMQSGTGSDCERTGFDTSGYIVAKGTPQGEGATFNSMPPGMDITNQRLLGIHDMPLKKLVGMSYPGDGGFATRDIPE